MMNQLMIHQSEAQNLLQTFINGAMWQSVNHMKKLTMTLHGKKQWRRRYQ
jgi:hypothetical protein